MLPVLRYAPSRLKLPAMDCEGKVAHEKEVPENHSWNVEVRFRVRHQRPETLCARANEGEQRASVALSPLGLGDLPRDPDSPSQGSDELGDSRSDGERS